MTTMEDLTKTQIILLTLLVSFVTSIATGIITASLLAEAPVGVTQTINRVVEHTIEKVVPASPGSTVKEVTIVKEEDAVIDAIDKAVSALVRVYRPGLPGSTGEFYALGVVVEKGGLVLTDKRNITPGMTFTLVFNDGKSVSAEVSRIEERHNIALLQVVNGEIPDAGFRVITLASNELKLGQSVIAVEGRSNTVVALGRVLGINQSTDDPATPNSVTTDVDPSGEIGGSPLLNLSGELVGVKGSRDDLVIPQGSYVSLSVLKQFITARE